MKHSATKVSSLYSAKGIGAAVAALAFGVFPAGLAPQARAQHPATAPHAALPPEYRALGTKLSQLGRAFAGDVGIAVQDLQTGQIIEYDGYTFFPQQSVSKLWVNLAAMELAEHRRLDLNSRVTLTTADLTLFHQPIAAQIAKQGRVTLSLNELIHRAMQQSDNTANDAVLRSIGGPGIVRNFLERHGFGETIRFGPGERLMQSRLAGLQWRPEYSHGRAFYAARNNVPMERRQAAFASYVSDPVDGATPVAMVRALSKLKNGEILPRAAADRMLDIMARTRTGPRRLKGGLAPGWSLAHKTGTGQQLQSVQTGYNDVGVITSPEGRSYALAVMIRKTAAPVVHRMEFMQTVTRSVIEFDRSFSDAHRMQLVANVPAADPDGSSRTRPAR
jgi:beta-lactamase class A